VACHRTAAPRRPADWHRDHHHHQNHHPRPTRLVGWRYPGKTKGQSLRGGVPGCVSSCPTALAPPSFLPLPA